MVIRGTEKMKALGMYFTSRPDMAEHVNWVVKSMKTRFWMLRNLKRSGFNTKELVQVYKTMIRPVAEYRSVVYHSRLTDEQNECLDRHQNQDSKYIFGPLSSGRRMRQMPDITTLRGRCIAPCNKFAKKSLSNLKFQHWFLLKVGRTSN